MFKKLTNNLNRPKCINYGCKNLATFSSVDKKGNKRWRIHCGHCQGASYQKHPHADGVVPFKTGKCKNNDGTLLGFPCPVDYIKAPWAIGYTEVDHIDGNHANNEHDNLMELCHFCHKNKGRSAGDYKGHRYRK